MDENAFKKFNTEEKLNTIASSKACHPPASTTPKHAKKKHNSLFKKILIYTGIGFATILTAFVIAGLCTNWFGLYGPLTKIALASLNTWNEQNFTTDYEVEIEGKVYTGTLQYNLDIASESLCVNGTIDVGKTEYIVAIYDHQLIVGTEKRVVTKDISQHTEKFITSIKNSKNNEEKVKSFQEFWDNLEDDLPDSVKQVLEEYDIDYDILGDLLKSFFLKKLNRTSWLKENAGYSYEKQDELKIHRFNVDAQDFINTTLPEFKESFRDKNLYQQAQDDLKNKTDNLDIKLVFGIKGNELSMLQVEWNKKNSIKLSCQFYEIGSTKIDEDYLSQLLDKKIFSFLT